jgi:hypothetical protein
MLKIKFMTNLRFSTRESAAVSEWLSSELPFHIMRDHNYHNSRILAGMWGAKLGNGTRERYGDMVSMMLQEVSLSYVYLCLISLNVLGKRKKTELWTRPAASCQDSLAKGKFISSIFSRAFHFDK